MIGTSLQIVLGLFLPCLLTAAILTEPPTGSQSGSAKQLLTVDDIDEMIEETRRCGEMSALSMSIVSQNQMAVNPLAKDLIYAKAFGKKNLDSGVDASNETLFCIASITKQFTSTLLMKMLNLARKQGHNYTVKSLVKEFDKSLDFEGSHLRDVTLEDALSHQTGIAESGGTLVGYHDDMTRAKLAQLTARSSRYQPNREMFRYSNLVYTVAGHVTEILGEKRTGTPVSWESLLREHLLEPLGISGDVEFMHIANTSRIVTPYYYLKGVLREADLAILQNNRVTSPSGAMCMSANAMIPWIQFLLGKGSYKGQQIVESEDIENTWRPRLDDYGLGWYVGTHRGHAFVHHGGSYTPYSSFITVFPNLNISFFTAINVPDNFGLHLVHLNMFDRLMGFDPVDSIHCTNNTKVIPDATADETALVLKTEEYVGVYANPVHGHLEIINSNGALRLLIGKVGNATIRCTFSATKCVLGFEGATAMIFEADGLRPVNKPYPVINFWKNEGEHVHTVSMPWYSDLLIEFHLAQPKSLGSRETILSTFLFCLTVFTTIFY